MESPLAKKLASTQCCNIGYVVKERTPTARSIKDGSIASTSNPNSSRSNVLLADELVTPIRIACIPQDLWLDR